MPSSLDLTVYPLVRQANQDQNEWPGLHVAEPPRRPARSRAGDRLILYLCLEGNAPLSSGKLEQVLERLGKTFYETSGSVTAALRTVAESLNATLLERNLRNANTSRQEVGLLTLAALRGDQLYLTQSGPVHAFVVAAGQAQHLYDPDTSGRGLGMSRATLLRFFQTTLQPNDTLLLACQPSPAWSAGALAGLHGQRPESLRQKLVTPDTPDVNAVLLQARTGTGKVNVLKSAGAPGTPEKPASGAPLPDSMSEVHGESRRVELPQADQQNKAAAPVPAQHSIQQNAPPYGTSSAPQTAPQTAPQPAQQPPSQKAASAAASPIHRPAVTSPASPNIQMGRQTPSAAISPTAPVEKPPEAGLHPGQGRPAASPIPVEPVKRVTGTAGSSLSLAFRQLGRGFKTLLLRMLPGEALFTIPTATMALIAIAVPLMIVAAASMVYLQRGRASLYGVLFTQASQSAAAAITQTEPQEQRESWRSALQYLDAAETYRITTDSRALRIQGQAALDELDLARRVDYQPAILNGLPENVRVSQMAVSAGDLYLLDSLSGNILHAQDTVGQGYELDTEFHCGPGDYGSVVVGPLIDLSPAPQGSPPELAVLAIDSAGNLLTCYVNDAPVAVTLAPPATAENWGQVTGFIVDHDLGHLYVLDPADRAVWAYWSGLYTETPQLFFDEQAPELQDVVDLTVNHNELYLLHSDGRLTLCDFSNLGGVPTRCSDIPYVDYRRGLENTPLTPQNPFQQVMFSLPPNPSLYFLEPQSQTVFHFSLRNLGFQRQYLPARELSKGPATAFAVHHLDHTIFLAIGNQVYYGSMP